MMIAAFVLSTQTNTHTQIKKHKQFFSPPPSLKKKLLPERKRKKKT